MKTKQIFNRTLAKFLLEQGCTIVQLEPNYTNKERTVFIFKYNQQLKEALSLYQKKSPNHVP